MVCQVEKVKMAKLSIVFESIPTSAIINCSPSACNPLGVCLTTKLTSSPSNQLESNGCRCCVKAFVVMNKAIVANNSVGKFSRLLKDRNDGSQKLGR